MRQQTNLHVGLFGKDNGHDFEIVDTRDAEVQIRYIKDGKTAWFARNRFELTGSGLKLN